VLLFQHQPEIFALNTEYYWLLHSEAVLCIELCESGPSKTHS
jgi:hypothetical protein